MFDPISELRLPLREVRFHLPAECALGRGWKRFRLGCSGGPSLPTRKILWPARRTISARAIRSGTGSGRAIAPRSRTRSSGSPTVQTKIFNLRDCQPWGLAMIVTLKTYSVQKRSDNDEIIATGAMLEHRGNFVAICHSHVGAFAKRAESADLEGGDSLRPYGFGLIWIALTFGFRAAKVAPICQSGNS